MTFGEKLQTLRARAGLSQDQLAELLEVSRQAVSKWERNEAMPEAEKIVRISRQFRVSTDYLLLEEREEPEAPPPPRRKDLGDWLRDWGWLLGVPMVLYGLWRLADLWGNSRMYAAMLLDMYDLLQAGTILLGTYAPWLTPAVGGLAAGLTAAVGGDRRRGRLDWRPAGAPLMAGGAAVELMLLLAWGLTAATAPEPWEQGFLLYGGSLIWGLVLALAGLVIWLAGRRKRP